MNDFMIHGSTTNNMQRGGGGMLDGLVFLIGAAIVLFCPGLLLLIFFGCLIDDIF